MSEKSRDSSSEYHTFCAYCLSPLGEGDRFCSVCGGNTADDPGVEMTEAEYMEMPRKPCVHCGTLIIRLTRVCFACKRQQKT